ncbi:MAG TPA: T9SS type A sorting domain-containing protein [Ignavibacteriaceae bacterium]|nr:T9SS type A sorting domain-containing protein [Ignavibacteriaceae bacterium]
MKKLFILMIITMFSLPIIGQTFSNGTGGGAWSSPGTWLSGVVPNINSDVVIAGTDSVFTAAGAVCNSLTILSGGKLATGIDSVACTNTFEVEADAFFYNASSKGTVPGSVRILDPASTVVHSGSGTVGAIGNSEFGNLVIKRLEGCTPGTNLIIKGNLVINNSAATVVFRGARPATGSQEHTVHGNIIINMGTLSCLDVGDNSMFGIWNVKGDVIISGADARFSGFSSANAAGLAVYNIDGSIINNGGRVQVGTSSSAGPGQTIINLKRDFTFNSGTFATNSLGSYSINLVGSGVQNFYLRGANLNLNTELYDTVKAGSTVVMDLDTNKWGSATGGHFVVNGSLELKNISRLTGSGAFTLNPNATLKIGHPDGITSSLMTGSVQMIGGRNFSSEANYAYMGTASQVFGDAFPQTVSGLTISNSNGMMLVQNLLVSGNLTLLDGYLDLNGNTLTLGSNALISETPGKTVRGTSGKLVTTRDIGVPSGVNVGGLGAVITSSVNMGSTTIERYHSARSGSGNSGIFRAYNISPSNNSGLNATLRFYYDESELNGIPEANLIMFKSPDGSENSWSKIGGTVNTNDNFVEASGINDFSYWTLSGTNNPLPVENEKNELPKVFSLHQNYPNPFNPVTSIRYDLPKASFVNISVYNIIGQKVAELVNGNIDAGVHSVYFNADKLSSGVYIYKFTSAEYNYTLKMNLLK